jgi:hypothetical protein
MLSRKSTARPGFARLISLFCTDDAQILTTGDAKRTKGRDRSTAGSAKLRNFIAAVAAIAALAGAVYAQSLAKASNRIGSDRQIEQTGPAKVG